VPGYRTAAASLAVASTVCGLFAGTAACRRGQSSSPSRKDGPFVRWSVDVGAVPTASAVAVAPDGTVYVAGRAPAENPPRGYASADGFWQVWLSAVDAQGRIARRLAGTVGRQVPEVWVQVAAWGTVFAVDADGGIYGFLAGGGELFNPSNVRVSGPPAIGSRGELYLGGQGLRLLALESEEPATSFGSTGLSVSAPAMAEDGSLFFADGRRLYGVSPWGEPRWETAFPGGGRPVLAPGGTLYIAHGQVLSAFATDGQLMWDFDAGFPLATPPAVASDGSVYVATTSGLVLAFEGQQKRWSFALEQPIASHLSVGPDGAILAADRQGKVYAVDPDGRRRWSVLLPSRPGTPVPGPDGTVYVACADGRLYAVAPPGGAE